MKKYLEFERFRISNFNFVNKIVDIFTYDVHVKLTGPKFHIGYLGVRNMYFIFEMEGLQEIFISHMKLKQFTYEKLFSYVKFL